MNRRETISNMLADMTIGGASKEQLEAGIRFSAAVIDFEREREAAGNE